MCGGWQSVWREPVEWIERTRGRGIVGCKSSLVVSRLISVLLAEFLFCTQSTRARFRTSPRPSGPTWPAQVPRWASQTSPGPHQAAGSQLTIVSSVHLACLHRIELTVTVPSPGFLHLAPQSTRTARSLSPNSNLHLLLPHRSPVRLPPSSAQRYHPHQRLPQLHMAARSRARGRDAGDREWDEGLCDVARAG